MACDCTTTILFSCGCQCGNSDCVIPEPTQGPQGIPGPVGATGASGTNGQDSFTVSTASFVAPAVGNGVVISVINGLWAPVGSPIFIQSAGFYVVTARTSTTITATNLGSPGNTVPATVIGTGRQIGPAGYEGTLSAPITILQGGTGQTTKTASFNALSPLSTAGDTLVFESGSNVRKPIGTSGQIPVSNGTVWNWGLNAPAATSITGVLPIANGGTGASTTEEVRTNFNLPVLFGTNEFVGQNSFDQTSGAFTVNANTNTVIYVDGSGVGTANGFYDNTGVASVLSTLRFLQGRWSIGRLQYVTANASTYVIPAISTSSQVAVVVSTYSGTGAQVITLPAGVDGRVVKIIDSFGNAGTNNIILVPSGSDTIIGLTNYDINQNYGSVSLIFYAATSKWIFLP